MAVDNHEELELKLKLVVEFHFVVEASVYSLPQWMNEPMNQSSVA